MTPQPEPLVEIAGDQLSPVESDDNRRSQSDRRQTPTSPWAAFPPAGQRTKMRRTAEHRLPYFVDRFSFGMLLCILMLIIASLADASLTVHVLRGGGTEVNPLMDYLLGHGVTAFLVGKYLLTVVGLPLLLIFKNHYLFGTRLRVGYLIPVCVALYAVLIVYQIILIDQRVGW